MTSVSSTGSFVGCWTTTWSVCNGGKSGVKLAIKADVVKKGQFTGAWGGHTDINGDKHSGFLIGQLDKSGKTLTGTWYEIIYRDAATCPRLSYSGTFSFTLDSAGAFNGYWTGKDGANKDCAHKMEWNGNREAGA